MFGIEVVIVTRLDDCPELYSVEPWIEQMKKNDAAEKMKGAKSTKRNVGLFTMMGKTAQLQAGGGCGQSAALPTSGEQQLWAGGGGANTTSSTVLMLG